MKRSIQAALLGLISILAAAGAQAGTISNELDAALRVLGPDDTVPVIIKLKARVDLTAIADVQRSVLRQKIITALKQKAATTQRTVRNYLRSNGATNIQSYWVMNGLSATVPARGVKALARLVAVERVAVDRKLSAPPPAGSAPAFTFWNLNSIRAPELWQMGVDGQGVVVGIVDTGVDPFHVDLAPRWRGGSNSWFDPHGEHGSPFDSDGHGTQAAGLVLGGSTNGIGKGVAPGARWIGAKIFSNAGEAPVSAIHASFQWLLDPDGIPGTDDAPDIVNNSWAFLETLNQCDTEFADDIAVLKAAQIAVLFSAGNSGPSPATSLSPPNNEGVVAVGSVDSSSNVSIFSSRGPSACGGGLFPQLVAPGDGVYTTDLTFGGAFPDSTVFVSGTSFSVAHVAGAMALLKSAFPEATVEQLETSLLTTAVDVGETGAGNNSGYGLLDIVEAYNWLAANTDPQPGDLQLNVAGYSIGESGNSVTVDVARVNGSAGSVTVDYATADASATAGLDYTAASGTLSFGDGEVSRSIQVPVLDDTDYEGDETFDVMLSNPTGGAGLGSPTSGSVTILEDDPAPSAGDLQLAAADYSVAENGGSVTIQVERVRGSAGAVSVAYGTSDGTALAGSDYTATSGTLSFADGQSSRTFSVAIVDDNAVEDDETFAVNLSNPTGGVGLGSPISATVTILDEDTAGPVDADSDGVTAGLDCDDNDASVYPGAPEVKHDGIDQDCNGYDLTIDVTSATYRLRSQRLVVYATTDLAGGAGLQLTMHLADGSDVTRNMSWSSRRNRWQKSIKDFESKFGAKPVSVTVFGAEGAETATITERR